MNLLLPRPIPVRHLPIYDPYWWIVASLFLKQVINLKNENEANMAVEPACSKSMRSKHGSGACMQQEHALVWGIPIDHHDDRCARCGQTINENRAHRQKQDNLAESTFPSSQLSSWNPEGTLICCGEKQVAENLCAGRLSGPNISAWLCSSGRVFTRRKAGELKRSKSKPLVLTKEMLATLFDRPLKQAASSLGVSATALKGICRKLEVYSWLRTGTRGSNLFLIG